MRAGFFAFSLLTLAVSLDTTLHFQTTPKRTPKEALRALNDLIGIWRGTATPSGTKQQQQDGFWVETITWEWQFKDKDVWLSVEFDKSKHFSKGVLRFLPDKNEYALTLTGLNKREMLFTGSINDSALTLDSVPDGGGAVDRIVVTLLHDNRHLYRLDRKPAERTSFSNVFKVGATKQGVDFTGGAGQQECIVTGGLGTIPVLHNGVTYYVCCSGCATEFRGDPAKYVKEFEEKRGAKKK